MKTKLFPMMFLLVAFQLAIADDFKSVDGKEYKNVTVSRVEPDGIVVTFSGGIVKIPFTELSPEIQKKYGYDPKAAADFQQQTYQSDVLRAQQLAEAREKRQQEIDAQRRAQPQPTPTAPARRQSIAASMHDSPLDRPSGPKTLIYGKVLNVVDEGLLISVYGMNTIGTERIPDGATVLFLGNFPGFYDDDRVQAVGIAIGKHEYTTVIGSKRTARAFETVSVNKLP